MRVLSLIFRITAILAAIVSGFLFFLSNGKLEKQQKEIQQLHTRLQLSEISLQSATEEISSLQEKSSTKTESLEATKVQLEKARAELDFGKKQVLQMQGELEQMKINAARLEETANHLRKELVQTERMLASVSNQNNESRLLQLNERIDELLITNNILRQEIARLEALKKN